MQPTSNTPERWLPVPGWEGRYEVSDRGNVRSLDRTTVSSLGRPRTFFGKKISPATLNGGHLFVILYRSGVPNRKLVHHLVLEAFVGPRPEGMETRHLDGNPANNHLSNLRWGSRRENILDRVSHGVHNNASKTHCKRGHLLQGENLIPSKAKIGKRACKACAAGADWAYRTGADESERDRYSNEYYERKRSEA